MDIKQQANEVVNRIEAEYKIRFAPEAREATIAMLVSLAEQFPADRPGDGVDLIRIERARQMKEEGWSADHDAAHEAGELAIAAACYAFSAAAQVQGEMDAGDPRLSDAIATYFAYDFWPWDRKWWKPKNKIRDLVRAGALMAAEIDRLKRLEKGA